MRLAGQLYLIYPTTTADVGQVLTEIEVPEKFTSVLRTIMRLETVYLATGSFEQGWQAACKRADIELEMSPDDDDEYECYSCDCTFPERPNTVHRCDECGKQGLCAGEFQWSPHGPSPRILCNGCASEGVEYAEQEKTKLKQQAEKEKTKSKQQAEQEKTKSKQQIEQEKTESKQVTKQKKTERQREKRAELHPALRFRSMIWKDLHKRKRPVEPTEEYKSHFTNTRETLFVAFQAKWASTDDHFRDAYRGQEAPTFDKAGNELLVKNWPGTAERDAIVREARIPFRLTFDALDPMYLIIEEGIFFNHHPDNLRPTTHCLNMTRKYYAPLIIALVARVVDGQADLDETSRKFDHIYLIALQYANDVTSRYATPVDDPKIATIREQFRSGTADPEACAALANPWMLNVTNRAQNWHHRYSLSPDDKRCFFEDLPRLKDFVADLEAHFEERLPRTDGEDAAVYLFHHENMPQC